MIFVLKLNFFARNNVHMLKEFLKIGFKSSSTRVSERLFFWTFLSKLKKLSKLFARTEKK